MTAASDSDRVSPTAILRVFRSSLRYARPYRGRIALKVALTVLALAPSLLVGFPVKIIVDHVVLGTPIADLFASDLIDAWLAPLEPLSPRTILLLMIGIQVVLVVTLGVSGSDRDLVRGDLASGQDDATQSENDANSGLSYAGGLFGLFDFRFMLRLTQDLNHHYRSSLFGRIQSLPAARIHDERIGDAVYRIMYDTPAITRLVYRVLQTPVVASVQILIALTVLYLLFPAQLEVVAIGLAFVPLIFAVTLPFAGVLRRAGLRSRHAGARATSTLEEGVSNVRVVQSLGTQDEQRQRFEAASWETFGRYRAFVLARLGVLAAAIAMGLGLTTYAFVTVTDAVIAGQLSPGDFALMLTLYFQVLLSAAALGGLWIELQSAAPGLSRVFFLMDQPSESEWTGARALPMIRRGIELCDVDFDYPDGTAALRDVSLEIPVGSVTALCGPAGAGKTTLAQLIPRFAAPTRGVVRADGVDLEQVGLASIRSQVAFVFQETTLLDATVAENIRLADPQASDAAVQRAAELAGADEFIRRLPAGYDTPLGRDGGALSVGQRQRISIARALVRDCSVLILDEPTSALDPDTERRLVQSLTDASRTRAVLVIAHRMNTIRHADQIVFLDGGRIVERGTHDELIRLRGAYARFVEIQGEDAA